MQKLNLPDFPLKLKEANGKVWIFDGIRKKYVVLTPEEWVRQHFVQFMVHELNYPRALIKLEAPITYNHLAKRPDILVFDHYGSPWMVVECKAWDVTLDEQTARQVSVYNLVLKAPFVAVTNGLKHFCFQTLPEVKSLQEFPVFG